MDSPKREETGEALERALLAEADRDPETLAAVRRGLEDVKAGRYVADEDLDACLERLKTSRGT